MIYYFNINNININFTHFQSSVNTRKLIPNTSFKLKLSFCSNRRISERKTVYR